MSPLASRLPVRSGSTTIRLFCEADVEAFHAYRSDPDLARFQGWSVMSHDEARTFVFDMIHATHLVAGDWVQLAIAQASDDVLIGDIGIFLNEDLRWGEIGFTLCTGAHGHGHATRAVIAAIVLLFDVSRDIEIRGVTDARNVPSVAVLERSGFKQVAVEENVFKGEPCTELVYSLRCNDA
jgi:RimJ/RimL family protein N-acetyltransferase